MWARPAGRHGVTGARDGISVGGDGERGQAGRGVSQDGEQLVALFGREEEARDHADDPRLVTSAPACEHGVEAVLGFERLPHLRAVQPDAGQRPAVAQAALGQLVEVDGLVSAVKGPDPEVYNARAQRRAVIAGNRDAPAVVGERVLVEGTGAAHRAATYPYVTAVRRADG